MKKKLIKKIHILLIVVLGLPNILLLNTNVAYADVDSRVSEAKNEAKSTLTASVKNLITSNSEQNISSVSTSLKNLFSYKTGNSKNYSEGGPTWGKSAFVISMNPVYSTDGLDTNLLKVDVNQPGNGATDTLPSSINITAKTNKKIDTSFWLEVRTVYTVYQTNEWETFWGNQTKTMTSRDFLENPISIRVHVTKDNEEGAVNIKYTDVDTGNTIMNDTTVYGKIGESYDQEVKADYESKKAYIEKQFYKYSREDKTTGKYMDGTVQAEYQFERIQGGDILVNYVNNEKSVNDKQKMAFGSPTSDMFSGKYGESKVATAKNIPHYETVDGVTEKKITLNENPQQIIFEYKLSQAKPLTVKYLDQDGKTIPGVDSKLITGRWGDAFTVVPREEIPFYTLVDDAKPIKGELTDQSQEIVYHYKVSDGAPILIHYVDEAGEKLVKDKVLSGMKFGQQFTEKAINIDHYRQKKDEIKGQITDKQQEITFAYMKNDGNPVMADFKDDSNNLINESYLLNGKYDESFDISEKNTVIRDILSKLDSKHYKLTGKSGVLTGKFTDNEKDKYSSRVTYKFEKKMAPGKITVRYINSKNGEEIATSVKLSGKYDEFYTSESKIIKNYHLTKMPTEVSGKFGDVTSELSYLYEPNVGGTVQLNYISKETQKPISTSDVENGGVNQPYQFIAKEIQHYVVSTTPSNAKGFYPDANNVINIYFEYERARAKPIHIVYQDDEGHVLDKNTLSGENKKWNDPFKTELKSFTGYEIKNIKIDGKETSLGNGFYDDESEQTIIYTYKLKKAAPISVKYLDLNMNTEISGEDIIVNENAVYGDTFQSQPKEISHYIYKYAELNQIVVDSSDISGTFTDNQQSLIYYYTKDKATLVTKNSQIYLGSEWSAADNFEDATDREGNPVDIKGIRVEGAVDTTKTGTYKVTYSYDGLLSIATVVVKENKTAVSVHDSTIHTGDAWHSQDNFDSAVDEDGNQVAFKEVTVEGTIDTTKTGIYKISYKNGGVVSIASITVKDKEINQLPADKTDLGKKNKKTCMQTLPITGEKTSYIFIVIGLFINLSLLVYLSKSRKKSC